MEKFTVAASATRSLSPSGYFSCVVCSEDTEEQGPIVNFCGHVFCWLCLYACVTNRGTCRRLRGSCPICQCGIDLCPRTQTVCRIYHIAGAQSNNSFTSMADMIVGESSGKNHRDNMHIDKPRDKRLRPLGNFVFNSIMEVGSAQYLFEERMLNLLSCWSYAETQLKIIVQVIQMTAGNLREELSHSGGAPVDAFYDEITELVNGLTHEIMHCQEVFETILEVRQTWIDLHSSLTCHHPPRRQLASSLPNQIAKFKEEDRATTSEEQKSGEIRKFNPSIEVRIQSFLDGAISKSFSYSRSPSQLRFHIPGTLDEHVHNFSCYPLSQRCLYHGTELSESTNKENCTKEYPNEGVDSTKDNISRIMCQIEALMDDFKTVMDKNRRQLHSFSNFIEEKTRLFLTGLEDGSMYLTCPTLSKGILKTDVTDRWINDPPKCWSEVLDVDAAAS